MQELDPKTLLLPDRRGNDRLDSLRDIVRDDRVSLMFMVPGSPNVLRVNVATRLTTDPTMTDRFDDRGATPKLVIIVIVTEISTQCARAILRARLRGETPKPHLPTVGEILAEQTDVAFDGTAYDPGWPDRAARSIW